MATMTKLFEKVTANDYIWLEELVQSKKEVNWNCIRFKLSLIHKAIEVRALKCFDILINIPEITVYSNSSGQINGMMRALEYYIEAPNEDNLYYVNKLLEKNVFVSTYDVMRCINNDYMFNMLFNKIDKNKTNITNIISNTITNNNLALLIKMYEYIESNNMDYYTPDNKIVFNNMIFKIAVDSLNHESQNKQPIKLQLVEYIMTKNVEWTNITNVPILYYSDIYNKPVAFNYFLQLFQNMSAEEINNIPNIKDFTKYLSNKYYTNINLNSIKSILALPIDFNDMSSNISILFKQIYQDTHYTYSSELDKKYNIYSIIFYIYSKGLVKINPYLYMVNETTSMKQYIEYIKKSINNNIYKTYCMCIRMFIYINSKFGFEMPDNIKTIYDFILVDINIENEKTDLFAKLDSIINPVPVVKKSKKKATKNITV